MINKNQLKFIAISLSQSAPVIIVIGKLVCSFTHVLNEQANSSEFNN